MWRVSKTQCHLTDMSDLKQDICREKTTRDGMTITPLNARISYMVRTRPDRKIRESKKIKNKKRATIKGMYCIGKPAGQLWSLEFLSPYRLGPSSVTPKSAHSDMRASYSCARLCTVRSCVHAHNRCGCFLHCGFDNGPVVRTEDKVRQKLTTDLL